MTTHKDQVGEKEFLAALGAVLHPGAGLEWRDDCVIAPLMGDLSLAYSIDRPEQIFSSGDPPHDLRCFGRWSASLVANDVIACGVQPRGISFDVGVDEMGPGEIEIWARGVVDVCQRYGMRYEGGNLGIGPGVTGVVWGIETQDRLLRRRGAKHGALLIATGWVGLGWAIRLWRNAGKSEQRLGEYRSYQQEPWVNLQAFKEVWDLGAILSSMDITDGIIEFGYEVYEQDSLGVVFEPRHEDRFPLNFVFEELGLPSDAVFYEPGYDTPFTHGWCVDPD